MGTVRQTTPQIMNILPGGDMKTRSFRYGFLAAAVCCILMTSCPTAQGQVDLKLDTVQVRWPDVTATVRVTCNGTPDTTMTAQDFILQEDGTIMQPLSLQYRTVQMIPTYSAALVLDGSGSTLGSWNAGIKNGASAFVDEMDGVNDEATVIRYSSVVNIVQQMTTIKPLLHAAINTLTASGLSATWDGTYASVVELINNARRDARFAVVVGDGPDNASTRTPAEVISLANRNRIRIFTIGCGTAYDQSLETVALLTGGRFYNAATPNDLPAIYRAIENSITALVTVCDISYSTSCPDGSSRSLNVELTNFCGGSDSETRSFTVPRLPAMFTPVDITLSDINVMAGEPADLTLSLDTDPGGLPFSPCSFVLHFDPAKLTFVSAGPTATQILDGVPIQVTSGGGTVNIQVTGSTYPAGPGELLDMRFRATDAMDTLHCPVSIQQFNFSGGCLNPFTHDGSVFIDVQPHPMLEISGPVSFCEGDSVTFTAPEGYARYEWSTGDTTRSITTSTSGVYSVTVYTASGRSGSSDPVTVVVHAIPRPTLHIEGSLYFCEGKSVTLSVDHAMNYSAIQWSSGQTGESITVTEPGMYSATVTDLHGCTGSTDPVTVVVTPNFFSFGYYEPVTLCAGDTLFLDAGADGEEYSWSTGDSTRILSVTEPASYFVTTRNADGCISRSDTLVVHVVPKPEPEIRASGPLQLCPGDSVTLEVTTPYASYLWSTGEKTARIHVSSAGRYFVQATNAEGCSGISEYLDVTMPDAPRISPPGPLSLCRGASATLDAGEGYDSYLWSTGERTQTIAVSTAAAYHVTVTEGSCTMTSDAVEVTLVEALYPVIAVDGDSVLCQGESVVLDAGEYAGYHWSTGDTTRRIIVSSTGAYHVDVRDAFGCSGRSLPVSITVVPLPEPVIAVLGDAEICEGDSVVLDGGGGYARYAWSTGATTRSIPVKTGGTYTLTVWNDAGCDGSAEPVTITVWPAPAPPRITRTAEGLECSPAAAYQWYRDGTAIPGATSRTLQPPASGRYTVRIIGDHGCAAWSEAYDYTATSSGRFPAPAACAVYPEPNHGSVTLDLTSPVPASLSVVVTNLLGQQVYAIKEMHPARRHLRNIDLQYVQPGVYIIRIRHGSRIWTRRLIRQ